MTRFCFLIPTRNSASTLKQCLLSMAGQSHREWYAIVVDDASTDGTVEALNETAHDLDIFERFEVLTNRERLWEVANVVRALDRVRSLDDVCVRLDLDDYLSDLNALEIVAKRYERDPDLEALWSCHRWYDGDGITTRNISGPMPNGTDVYKHPWVASHLKTWRAVVSSRVSDANYRDDAGEYFRRAGDQAIYLPVLHQAKKWEFLPLPTYAYRCDMSPETFQTDDARFQRDEAEFIRRRGFLK